MRLQRVGAAAAAAQHINALNGSSLACSLLCRPRPPACRMCCPPVSAVRRRQAARPQRPVRRHRHGQLVRVVRLRACRGQLRPAGGRGQGRLAQGWVGGRVRAAPLRRPAAARSPSVLRHNGACRAVLCPPMRLPLRRGRAPRRLSAGVVLGPLLPCRAQPALLAPPDPSLVLPPCRARTGLPVATALCGPPGCGKTAAVHAAAAQLGFRVLEVRRGLTGGGRGRRPLAWALSSTRGA